MSGFFKKQGVGSGHAITNQGNKAKAASKGGDGALPSKQGGKVNRATGAKGHALTNQGAAPRASAASDGVGFKDGHMNEAMSDGGRSGPAAGKSFSKKFGTSEMSQAIRKRKSRPDPSALGSG